MFDDSKSSDIRDPLIHHENSSHSELDHSSNVDEKNKSSLEIISDSFEAASALKDCNDIPSRTISDDNPVDKSKKTKKGSTKLSANKKASGNLHNRTLTFYLIVRK